MAMPFVSKNIALFLAGPLTWMVTQASAQSSVLSQGTWFKIEIEKTGVYKLDVSQLKNAGAEVSTLDPRTLKVYGNPGGMLPQPNATARPIDLIENAIVVTGESDGVFSGSDMVLFYAQGADKQTYNTQKKIFQYEHNLYADKNYVFVTYGGENGKRIAQAPPVTSEVVVDTYEDVYHHEETITNLLKSGREWLGERFENSTERTFSIPMEGIVAGSTIKIVSNVVAASISGSVFKNTFNGLPLPDQTVASIPNTQYGIKARHKADTFLLAANTFNAPSRSSHDLKYTFAKQGTSNATGYLNYFTVTATRKLAVYGSQTSFRSLASLANAATQFTIDRAGSTIQVWDVTNSSAPQSLSVQVAGSLARVTTATTSLRELVAFNQPLNPSAVKKIANQNLRGIGAINLLMVTDDELREEAQRLADHRQSFSGITTRVVTVTEIYNEFSSGRPDVTAIRDFARLLKNNYPSDFKYLLLFGKGTYDYKNALRDNVNRVFTYESRNSTSPLETYSSDDYFALLSVNEGNWGECFSCNETLDIGVGRLPIKKAEQAVYIVDKLIQYDTTLTNRGSWQTDISFVADDGDFNTHQAQADLLANQVESSQVFNANKIYLDAFPQISRPAGQIAPEVNTTLKDVLKEGTLVLNYTGHGNEYQWANEKILDELLITGTDNTTLPFLVTATCEFGRHDDPLVTSVAEIALLRKNHGAIGLVTTARPVNSSTNFDLNQAFYESFLLTPGGRFQTLGDIYRATKNNSASGVANRNFSLLADPSMMLAFPQQVARVETIVTSSQSDTLQALSAVHVEGIVQTNTGEPDETFTGNLQATVFDKATQFATLGNESPPFNFKQWSSLLFKGEATVTNGRFEFDFIVPKNIAYAVGDGRISLFAQSATATAAGNQSVKIGGSAPASSIDTTPPVVRVFMNDTTFVNGGLVSPDAKLVVRLQDASGISISNLGIGNDLSAELDNDAAVYELTNHYMADADDFTKGTVVYPLRDLPPGKHRIRVMAWDTHNNPAEGIVDFVVTDGEAMVVEDFGNYPNPFDRETNLFFTHNTAGEDLRAEWIVYNTQGAQVASEQTIIDGSTVQVKLATWQRNDLPTGIYIARLFLRSVTSGKQAQAQAKLIIVN